MSENEAKGILSTIDGAVNFADRHRTADLEKELEQRKMVKSNHLITLKIVLHEHGDATRSCRMTVVASSQFPLVQQAIIERMGSAWGTGAKLRLSWLKDDGSVAELSQATWRDYIFAMWCSQPWVVHAHDVAALSDLASADVYLPLTGPSQRLFDKYDVNRNKRIERPELARLLLHARLERLRELGCDCSDALVARFVEHEFARIDRDDDGTIELDEFTFYISRMTAWMRAELLSSCNASDCFDRVAAEAVERVLPPVALPSADAADGAPPVTVLQTGVHGIRIEARSADRVHATFAL
jgi:hypothetical protein